VLLVEGEIDLATAPALEREALHALRDAHGRFILDLSATTFMDLSGARAAARLARHARALGGQLALVVVTPGVRLALRLVPPCDAILTRRLSTAAQALVDLQP
jgi:anti-anti-sigma factor